MNDVAANRYTVESRFLGVSPGAGVCFEYWVMDTQTSKQCGKKTLNHCVADRAATRLNARNTGLFANLRLKKADWKDGFRGYLVFWRGQHVADVRNECGEALNGYGDSGWKCWRVIWLGDDKCRETFLTLQDAKVYLVRRCQKEMEAA